MVKKILSIFYFLWLFINFDLAAQNPGAPSQLNTTVISVSQIDLSWTDNSNNEDFFVLERRTSLTNDWKEIAEIDPNITSYSDKGLSSATTYHYKIRARGTCVIIVFPRECFSSYSNEVVATTRQFPPSINDIPNPPVINEDAGAQTINISGIADGDSDVIQTINVVASSGNTNLIPDPIVGYTSPNSTGTMTYQPAPNQSGSAVITVTVVDNGEENNTATTSFTVVVKPVNDPPTLNPITSPAPVNEDSGEQKISLDGITAGPSESQDLSISAASDNKKILPDPTVVYTNPNSSGSIRYTPVPDAFGSAVITVTVTDSEGESINRSFNVSVLPVNDPPALDPIADPAPLSQDAGQQTIQLTGISAGPGEEQNLTVSATSGNNTLVPNPVVAYTSPGETGVLRFTPTSESSGSAKITVTVKDNGGTARGGVDIFQQSFTITVLHKPDLIIENALVTPITSGAGQLIEVSSRVYNRGKKDAATSTLAYYFSSVNQLDENAERLGENVIDPLSPDKFMEVSNSVQIPSGIAPGNYFLFFVADEKNTVDEFIEDNNMKILEIEIQNLPPQITNIDFPEFYTLGSQTESINITVQDDGGLEKVAFNYRPISERDWQRADVSSETDSYSFSLIDAIFDEIGLEYYFEIIDGLGLKTTSDTGYIYIRYPGDGLNIPALKTGNSVNEYQIIAIPLELGNTSILSIFEDDLGGYNKSQWRLFHYENDREIEYTEGLNNIEAGKGYWLITRDNDNIDTGIGSTVPVTKEEPFTIPLAKGWNQIGNPYNFNLSWTEILKYNGNPEGVGNLRVYNQGFKDSDKLERFKGAFVFAENAIDLDIPVMKNKSVNGGGSNGRQITGNRINDGSWEINFTLTGKNTENTLGGLGMKNGANNGKDRYDEVALPNFNMINNLEVLFDHPEHFYRQFSKDIAPISEEQTWEFKIVSDNQEEIELSWNKISISDKQLVLLDVINQKLINMQQINAYTFRANRSNKFQVLYGTTDFIEKKLQESFIDIGDIYPNPFTNQTTLPISLPSANAAYQVKVEVFDISGRNKGIITNSTLQPGRHEISWNGHGANEYKLPAGVYIIKLFINHGDEQYQFIKRVIIK